MLVFHENTFYQAAVLHLKQEVALAVLEEMLVVNALQILVVAAGNGRVDDLAVVNAVLLVAVVGPGFGKHALGEHLLHRVGLHIVLAVKIVRAAHVVAGQIVFRVVGMAHHLGAAGNVPAAALTKALHTPAHSLNARLAEVSLHLTGNIRKHAGKQNVHVHRLQF